MNVQLLRDKLAEYGSLPGCFADDADAVFASEQELQAENKRLRETNKEVARVCTDLNGRLQAENKRLRKLVESADWAMSGQAWRKRANEALEVK